MEEIFTSRLVRKQKAKERRHWTGLFPAPHSVLPGPPDAGIVLPIIKVGLFSLVNLLETPSQTPRELGLRLLGDLTYIKAAMKTCCHIPMDPFKARQSRGKGGISRPSSTCPFCGFCLPVVFRGPTLRSLNRLLSPREVLTL